MSKNSDVIISILNAHKILKKGDRIRVTKCPGTKRTITFECWDGLWIESKSGINDYCPISIDRLNGKPIDILYYHPTQEEQNIIDTSDWKKLKKYINNERTPDTMVSITLQENRLADIEANSIFDF